MPQGADKEETETSGGYGHLLCKEFHDRDDHTSFYGNLPNNQVTIIE